MNIDKLQQKLEGVFDLNSVEDCRSVITSLLNNLKAEEMAKENAENRLKALASLVSDGKPNAKEVAQSIAAEAGEKSVKGVKKADERKAKSAQMRRLIRESNDINEKWDMVELIDCLMFPSRVQGALIRHYQHEGKKRLSLKELMNLAVSDTPSAFIFSLQGVGKYGWRDMLQTLSALDLGENYGKEWKSRLDILEKLGDLTACSYVYDSSPRAYLRIGAGLAGNGCAS